ncbi:helix-turn-helix transcriptional regulator [Comamonas sp.]|uniref:helix-turn-helix domain-containing protein n=1 Tax=Comamonas sp. TaxID=34028 RepID=UPI0028AA2FFF|nr:helix-turn-helix transcriptional regulator [Comamonas sp.]
MILISVTYTLAPMPAQPLSPEQHADARRLKAIFEQWKTARKRDGLPSGQLALGMLLDINQSAVSQYLNGGIPLNAPAAAKFAKILGCQIDDFSSTLANEAKVIGEAVGSTGGDDSPGPADLTSLKKREMQLVLMYRELPEDSKDELLQHANRLHGIAQSQKSATNPYPHAPIPSPSPTPPPAKPATQKRTARKTKEPQSQ